jgi:prepilin-type N-terminal cleavage/methylation domain-containing protein
VAVRRAGFTLIEVLAVVAILALMATFVLPNLSLLRSRSLRDEARRVAAEIELGRQRSVMMGIPHRLYIDLDARTYRLEWWTTEAEARGERTEWTPPVYDLRGNGPLPLSPPREEERAFRPLPDEFGNSQTLDDGLAFEGLETPEGWVTQGETSVAFDREGTTSYAQIVIGDGQGERLAIDVLPLADAVRVHKADADGQP